MAGALRVVAGLLLIAMGLYLAGWWSGLTRVRRSVAASGATWNPSPGACCRSPACHGPLLLGAIWGWLPCRLVYSTLLWATSQGSALDSALLMLAFGLGTWPVLLATGMAAERVTALLRRRGVRIVGGLMVILFGLWTLPGPHQSLADGALTDARPNIRATHPVYIHPLDTNQQAFPAQSLDFPTKARQLGISGMLDTIRWDADLIRRYDLSGPRYTPIRPPCSSTKASARSTSCTPCATAGRPDTLSLYVHIPFCANICYYCACNKVITKDRGRSAPYLARLVRESRSSAATSPAEQVVEQLHFGGGTPTFLSPGQLRELMSQLRTHLNLLDDDSGDYGIEIDPREADWSTMGLLRELGFNRVSLGVQDFDMEVQKAVNRMQTPEETRTIVEAARAPCSTARSTST